MIINRILLIRSFLVYATIIRSLSYSDLVRSTMEKKAWVTPELIVLIRSNPEEAVLLGCKTSGVQGEFSDKQHCNVNTVKCLKTQYS
jgi:hypothetical protein